MMRALPLLLLSCLLGVSACSSSSPPPPEPFVSSSDTTVINTDVANSYVGTGNTVPAQPYTYNRVTDGLKVPNSSIYSNGYSTVETAQITPEASNYAAITPSVGTSAMPSNQQPAYNTSRSASDPYGRAPSYERTVGGGLIGGITGGLIGAACCGNPIVGAGAGIVIGIIGGVITGAAIDAAYPEK